MLSVHGKCEIATKTVKSTETDERRSDGKKCGETVFVYCVTETASAAMAVACEIMALTLASKHSFSICVQSERETLVIFFFSF